MRHVFEVISKQYEASNRVPNSFLLIGLYWLQCWDLPRTNKYTSALRSNEAIAEVAVQISEAIVANRPRSFLVSDNQAVLVITRTTLVRSKTKHCKHLRASMSSNMAHDFYPANKYLVPAPKNMLAIT